MRLDYYLPDGFPDEARSHGVLAARLGFDGIMASETRHDPFVTLASARQVGMDLGTSVAIAFARSPMVTAMAAWDLAATNRVTLGLGTQVKVHAIRRFGVEWDPPVPRLRGYMGALRAIWQAWQTGEPLRYEGEFYRHTLMTPFFDPGPIARPDIPIYVAGVGPAMLRLAGEAADGLHVHPFHTVRYLDEVVRPTVDEAARAAGRSGPVSLAASVLVATGRDRAELAAAVETVRRQIAFYASTPSYRRVLELHGWDVGASLSALARRGRWEEMVVDDEILHTVAVVGSPSEAGAELRRRYGERLDRVGIYPAFGLAEDVWEEVLRGLRGG